MDEEQIDISTIVVKEKSSLNKGVTIENDTSR